MTHEMRKLLTVVTEAGIERTLVTDLESWGVSGYTITDARGRGSRGVRDAGWDVNANIRIEIVCNERLAETLMTRLREKYYAHYAMISYVGDVAVLRAAKF